jgi:galactokinase
VNLLGEHTDYNDGFVLPAAINLACHVVAEGRDDRRLDVYSQSTNESGEGNLDHLPSPSGRWLDYVFGVAKVLEEAGFRLPGANLRIHSEVPLGAGLASSAALETCVAYALLDLAHHEPSPRQLALLCQRAENEFVGARCGIMDQFVACHGKAGHALLLDCRSLEFRPIAIPPNTRLVICNTMVKHAHADSEYNARRRQCEEAVSLLAVRLPEVRRLRDVLPSDLERCADLLPPMLRRRTIHVVEENQRVLGASEALEAGDMHRFGEVMAQSHESLRANYEVSCAELDRMVEIARAQRGIYGARMTGGGFGGCVIALVDAGHAVSFIRATSEAYHRSTGLRPDIYMCQVADGVGPEAGEPSA